MESWRGEKMSEVEIMIIAVVIVPISALYYKFHTISILQVRKLVIQVTSTSTIYKWGKIGPRIPNMEIIQKEKKKHDRRKKTRIFRQFSNYFANIFSVNRKALITKTVE